jgi:hypothetical protein
MRRLFATYAENEYVGPVRRALCSAVSPVHIMSLWPLSERDEQEGTQKPFAVSEHGCESCIWVGLHFYDEENLHLRKRFQYILHRAPYLWSKPSRYIIYLIWVSVKSVAYCFYSTLYVERILLHGAESFLRTWWFITVIATFFHWLLSWATFTQSILLHPVYLRSI